MYDELNTIAVAIESLKQEPNPIKDYVFPVAMAFFSTILGALVAYGTLIFQEKNHIQKDRVHSLNAWLLTAEEMLSNLVSIKSQYCDGLTDNPVQRALHTRSLIKNYKLIEKDIASLSFITPSESDTQLHNEKWRQVPRIRIMMDNYNLVMSMWKKRVEIDRPFREQLSKDTNLTDGRVTLDEIYQSISRPEFNVLVDITEKSIKFTDDLIIEIHDFLDKMPNVGNALIKKKYRESYGPLLKFSYDSNHKLKALIKRSIDVDYSILSDMFGKSEEEIKQEYKTGYE